MADTVTRTFSIDLDPTYVAGSIIELAHFRDMAFDADERVGVYLESWFCNMNLKSFQPGVIPEFQGDESEREKMSLFTQAENKSQKLGLRILIRKNNTGSWRKRAEIILINREREDYFDILRPYLAQNAVRILEKNDAIAVQLIDYGNGLLKSNDLIGIELGMTITISKKNSVDYLEARLSAIEFALRDYLTNVAPGNLLGRDETAGDIQLIPQSRFATPENIDQAIIDWVGTTPANLDTLKEFATAINNDANFAATVASVLTLKAPVLNPIFMGLVTTEGQIKFPAIQNPSTNINTLDDYTEGFWTPTVNGSAIAGTGTYTSQSGTFLKLGRRVFIECFIEWSNHNGTGSLLLTGLPYPSVTFCALAVWTRGLSLTANNVLRCYVPGNQGTQIVLKQIPTDGTLDSNIPMDVAAGLMISGSYLATL